PVRRVPGPGQRLEQSELLVLQLIALAENLDDLIIGIAMVGGGVVPRRMPQRTRDDRYLFLAQHVAGVLKMHEILELEGDVMQLHVGPGEEIHGVMIRVAAHEAEEIPDPIGDTKAEDPLVEGNRALDVGRKESDMPE